MSREIPCPSFGDSMSSDDHIRSGHLLKACQLMAPLQRHASKLSSLYTSNFAVSHCHRKETKYRIAGRYWAAIVDTKSVASRYIIDL
jgi:hypothetical protein